MQKILALTLMCLLSACIQEDGILRPDASVVFPPAKAAPAVEPVSEPSRGSIKADNGKTRLNNDLALTVIMINQYCAGISEPAVERECVTITLECLANRKSALYLENIIECSDEYWRAP